MGILFAFCLMPNHYHMLCETPGGDLGRMMRDLNGQYMPGFSIDAIGAWAISVAGPLQGDPRPGRRVLP